MSLENIAINTAALENSVAQLDIAGEEQDVASSDEVVALENEKEQKVFRFFDLPRELRDKIYAETTTDVWLVLDHRQDWTHKSLQNIDCALLESAPCVKIALINRQAKQEYEEEMDRKSTGATLTMAFRENGELYDRFRVNSSLRRALARVHAVTLTHGYRKISGLSTFESENDDMCEYALLFMKRCLSMFPSLGHLQLVYYNSLNDFQSTRHLWLYQPAEHDPAHIRRIFSSNFDGGFDESIEISSSVVLTENLFIQNDYSSEFPGCYRYHPINRIVLHGPASIDPNNIDMDALELDETESSSFKDLEEYHGLRQRSCSVPGCKARVWNAGYHMVNEPCTHSTLNWQWLESIVDFHDWCEE